MDNEDVIRDQMENTRTSLTEKLETLEKQVTTSVQGATTNVTETVEAVKDTVAAVTGSVKDTVDAVKESVQDTVSSVKESVADTINSVKDTMHDGWDAVKGMIDVPALVDSHPWAMFGGAVAAGFLVDTLLIPPAPRRSAAASGPKHSFPPDHYSGEDLGAARKAAPSMFAEALKTFEPEIKRLKGLALGGLVNMVREAVTRAVPHMMTEQVSEIFESFAQKIGADSFEDQSKTHGDHGANGRHAEAASRDF